MVLFCVVYITKCEEEPIFSYPIYFAYWILGISELWGVQIFRAMAGFRKRDNLIRFVSLQPVSY